VVFAHDLAGDLGALAGGAIGREAHLGKDFLASFSVLLWGQGSSGGSGILIAAFCYVGESVTDPLKYYFNNEVGTLQLLRAMLAAGVKKFVFSSTCATFGVPAKLPIHEDFPQAPINPYGQTKLDIENTLRALAPATGLSFAAFRYFNAAGASEDGVIGEDHFHCLGGETVLLKRPQDIETGAGGETDVDHDEIRLHGEHVADGCLGIGAAAAQLRPSRLDRGTEQLLDDR